VDRNKRKKDNDECQLVIVLFGCIERKLKKQQQMPTYRCLLWMHIKKTKKDDNEPTHHHLL